VNSLNLKVLTGVFALLFVVAAALWVYKAEVLDKGNVTDQQYSFTEPSERFTGSINGDSIIFEEKDYTKYHLTINGKVAQGPLNTERGYGDDIDATVYILDWNKPESEQKYFVRLTKDQKHIQELDNNRKIIPGALLVREI
jgi:uncharacterized protein YxeA